MLVSKSPKIDTEKTIFIGEDTRGTKASMPGTTAGHAGHCRPKPAGQAPEPGSTGSHTGHNGHKPAGHNLCRRRQQDEQVGSRMVGSDGKQGIYFISTHLSSSVAGTENGEDDDDENDTSDSGGRSKGGLSQPGELYKCSGYNIIEVY